MSLLNSVRPLHILQHTLTFTRIDHSMDMVNVAICVDVGMCGMVGREGKAAEGAALVEVEDINTLGGGEGGVGRQGK